MKSIIFSLLVVSAAVQAADLTTKSGKTYTEVHIDGPRSAGLAVSHIGGAVVIPYADLPDDLRKEYQADEVRAKEAAEAAAKRREEAAKLRSELLARQQEQKQAEELRKKAEEQKKRDSESIKKNEAQSAQDLQKSEEKREQEAKENLLNQQLAANAVKLPELSVIQIFPYSVKDRKTQYGVLASNEYDDEVAFIVGLDAEKMKDGDRLSNGSEVREFTFVGGRRGGGAVGGFSSSDLNSQIGSMKQDVKIFQCWKIGIYRYTNTMGATRSVAKYTANKKIAMEYFEKEMQKQ